ncbi:DUF1513 domain-containing protein [bacterium]|nr:MAG: DUF1513 domain-containing protein [bacterium]RIK60075.1 MAG: hypothetical protein DCC64_15145 [Planctomycetota bacterium]
MDISRRTFILVGSTWAGVTLLAAAGCTGSTAPSNTASNQTPPQNQDSQPKAEPAVAAARRGMLLGPGGRKTASGMEFFLAMINLDRIERYVSGELKAGLIPMTFRGHAVVPHPVERSRAVIFEKWGPGACEVDLKTLQPLRTVAPSKADRHFYGHGAWSLDGSLLYAVESEDRARGAYDGFIIIRDARTMEVKGEFPTFGKLPHDCHILDQGRTLAITNGGGALGSKDLGCVTFVDIASQKLIEKVTLPETLMAGHLAITARWRKGELAIGSTPQERAGMSPDDYKKLPGGLSLRSHGKELVTLGAPQEVTSRMLGETLSLAIHEGRGIVGATNPAGNIVTFWDVKEGKHLKSFDFNLARGIAVTLDQKYFVVSFGSETSIVLIDAQTLEVHGQTKLSPTGISGSHVAMYDI